MTLFSPLNFKPSSVKHLYQLSSIVPAPSLFSYCLENVLRTNSDSFLRCFCAGPIAVYDSKVTEKEIEYNEQQKKVATSLQRVYEEIQSYSPPKKGFFSKIFKEKSRAPQGVYLYGAVGGGKTMLMDLFYSCVKVLKPHSIFSILQSVPKLPNCCLVLAKICPLWICLLILNCSVYLVQQKQFVGGKFSWGVYF